MAERFEFSERLNAMPPYLFAEIDRMKAEKIKEGVDVIDFGVGDPDLPTPDHIVNALCESARKEENQKYPSYEGMLSFREAVAEYYMRRKGVKLDPEKEVVSLIGSKEGIAHLPLAFVNRGDYTLVPDPGYPVYHGATLLADGKPYHMILEEERGFTPDFDKIPEDVVRNAKIMFLNYPNNPTSAVCDKEFIKSAIDFCYDNNIILAHDAAYTDIYFEERPLSFLEIDSAFDVVVEFNSLSKTYNMTGWRIGFAVGNETALQGLLKVKTNVDSGVFQAVQEAGIAALLGSDDVIERNNEIYRERRDKLVNGLEKAGLKVFVPKATFYVWCKVPDGYGSMDFAKKLLNDAGILVTPGIGFGEGGEGFVRFALTRNVSVIEKAVERLEGFEF
ncbi:LL-diaminopimelate aminotransferase apoenzyme [Archaeoglobus sulfaticallidus PM70-1]|uniref:Aminotransferase n=1 Tax=Archaeoglobus sulfaticallidus PM70-1 TaxID=387631 RepID=N0BDM8_9EURY|nr:LL-diaminopimelate aminotransferase [Archaeoglobus sulfaticallidus]AGK61739.1 LL-diaminopimelate aminotransferase apoenzyme [Archaeoglobus sulfaticallidus PM70-1]